jgi:hypothetical protein
MLGAGAGWSAPGLAGSLGRRMDRAGGLYYARVLQIPTRVGSTYDAAKLHIPAPADVAATV